MWDEAASNHERGANKKFPNRYKILNVKRSGMRVSRFLWFVKLVDWNRWFSFTPATLGYKSQKMVCEFASTTIEGVLCQPTQGAPLHDHLVVEQWSEKCRFLVEESMNSDTRLRIKEPQETFTAMNTREQDRQVPDCKSVDVLRVSSHDFRKCLCF
jgi:hypothetical protein